MGVRVIKNKQSEIADVVVLAPQALHSRVKRHDTEIDRWFVLD